MGADATAARTPHHAALPVVTQAVSLTHNRLQVASTLQKRCSFLCESTLLQYASLGARAGMNNCSTRHTCTAAVHGGNMAEPASLRHRRAKTRQLGQARKVDMQGKLWASSEHSLSDYDETISATSGLNALHTFFSIQHLLLSTTSMPLRQCSSWSCICCCTYNSKLSLQTGGMLMQH